MDKFLEVLKNLGEMLKPIFDLFTVTIFTLGKTNISLTFIVVFFLAFVTLFYISNKVEKLLVKRILIKSNLNKGTIQATGAILKYIILTVGFFVIIHTAGIDLTALGFLAGALGVGIGFGLQNITNNFISGIIILFERPIKVGDRIEVGHVKGDVHEISARSTTIITNDNITLIVPNSEFISNTVINWSHNDRVVRFHFPVGVSYNEDPRIVRKIVLEVVNQNSGVLKKPHAELLFDSFGDSSLNFNLIIWTTEYTDRPMILKSQLYYAIFKKFKDNNIQIPFPQRDLHLVSGWGNEEEPESKVGTKKKVEHRILQKLRDPDFDHKIGERPEKEE